MRKSGILTRMLALVLMAAMILPLAPLTAAAEATAEYGYLIIDDQTILDRTVKFRPTPGSTDYVEILQEGWVMQVQNTVTYKGELWYGAKNPDSGKTGYIKGNFMQLMTSDEAAEWLAAPVQPRPIVVVTPTPVTPPGAGLGFVRTIADKVNLRVAPAGTVLTLKDEEKIPEGLVLAYYGEQLNLYGFDWVQVAYNGMVGYIRSDCYVKTDVYGNVPSENTPTPLPGTTPPPSQGYIKLIADKVAIRQTPAGNVLNEGSRFSLGEVIAYMQETDLISGFKWALVNYGGYTGYIRSDCYTYCDELGNVIYAPGVTPAPTAVPGTVEGYVRLTIDEVFIRETPAGIVLNFNDKLPEGLVLGYTERTTEKVKGYYWVKVSHNGYTGYVRSDCYVHCDSVGIEIPSPAPGVVPTPTPVPGFTAAPGSPTAIPKPTGSVTYGENTYGRTNTDKVFFRRTKSTSPNAPYWALLPYNWLLQVLGAEPDNNGTIWYHVKGGTPTSPNQSYTGYIHSDYFDLVTIGGAGNVPETDSDYAVITINGIKLRETMGGNAITALLSNTVVNIISRPNGTSASDWFYIEYNGDYGYVEATALRVLTKDELGNFNLPAAPAPTVTPSPTPPYTGTGYIKIIKKSVNIRKTPAGTSLTPRDDDKLPLGLILRYYEGPTEKISGYNWVKVNYNGIEGYVRSDCYVQCDMAGNEVVATPTPTPDSGVSGALYIRLLKGGVNLRTGPGGTSVAQLSKGTVLPYLGEKKNGFETWYEVYSADAGRYGFILSTMAAFCDANGNPVIVTPAPTTTPVGGGAAVYTGYVATRMSSVWVRSAAQVGAATSGKVAKTGTVLPVIGAKETPVGSSYSWYPIQMADGTRGYIRGDMVFELADWQLQYYNQYGVCPTPTPGPATPKPGNSDYIITTGDKLWVRQSASKKAGTWGQLALGTVTKFYGKQVEKHSNGTQTTWYEILFETHTGWLHEDFVRVLTNAEYAAWQGQNPGEATPTPSPMPDPSTFSDVGITTIDRVKIRSAASMSGTELRLVYDPGTKVTYLREYKLNVPASDGSIYNWFKIKYSGVTGWMRGDCVRILTEDEKAMYELAGDPDAAPEASYNTLGLGSSGDEVTKLQQALADKGYLAASEVNGYYGNTTEQAVTAFQRATSGLVVDGIAGEKTQHALFGTVPQGTYDGSSTSAVLYPVEKIDWFKGGIQSIFSVGTVATVTDVYTGISFKAQRLYGDNHADCEPKTVADTQAICNIYGVSKPQEIDDYEQQLQSYRRRPLWVTIGTRTFAASMYGIPHNPGGDRIPDNGYTGQFCIHFVNSMTHGSKDSPAHVDYSAAINGWFGHQEAIEYAYKNSKSGNK